MKLYTAIATAALCLAASFTHAQQQVTLEDVGGRSFSGVRSVSGGQYFYTFYFGEKTEKGMANFTLAIYDKDLGPVAVKNIEVTKHSQLAASAFSGKYFLFLFADLNGKTMTQITLDATGNTVKQVVQEDVPRSTLTADNYPEVHAINEEEFLIVRGEKEKKLGYVLQRVDKDLNVKWTTPFLPEKGIWTINDSHLANGKIYLLRKEKPNALWGDKYVYAVQCVDAGTGAAIYTTELKDADDGGFPNFIRVGADGKVATGGMYFNDGKYSDKNSDGFFFASIAPDGTMSRFDKHTWKSVQESFKSDWLIEFMGGKTKVLLEDLIQKKDGSYTIVGEMYRKGSANATGDDVKSVMGAFGGRSNTSSSSFSGDQTGFTVLDFVFLNFDANGNFNGIQRVSKNAREAIVRGSMSKENGLELAQWMANKKRFFTYRYTIENNDKQYIVYKDNDGLKSKAYFLPVGGMEPVGSIDMDKWVSEGLNKLGKFSQLTGDSKHTFESTVDFGQPESYEIFKNIVPAKPGYMMLYNLSNGKLTMWLEPVAVQ